MTIRPDPKTISGNLHFHGDSREIEIEAAVVSRGGRPDLAAGILTDVRAATLFVAGGNDGIVLDLNHEALGRMRCIKQIEVIPGASHLFDEPGALEKVAHCTSAWYARHLV
ncbi:MAG: hypothetical protein GF355_10510 [Candidatus Eisenbacteria bacterium]|nr:hypothetical protein [Candidatus Eisenbacteria bacterium]